MKKTILTFILFTHFSCTEESTKTNCLYQVNNERLYVKSVYWGLNGNSRTVKISQNKNPIVPHETLTTTDITYDGYFPIYLKVEKDTLFIYTYVLATIPKRFRSNIKIKQIEISNKENMMFINDKKYIDVDKICE